MMNFKQIYSLVAVVIFLVSGMLLVASCSDDGPVTPESSNLLVGTVIDSQGNPVEGAGILINYALPMVMRPTTQIQFQIPEPVHAKAWIMNECQTDTVKVILDEDLSAGVFQVSWNAANIRGLLVPSGLYEFHLQYGTEYLTQPILLMHGDYHPETDPATYQFQTTTDTHGAFSMEQSCLPFGFTSYSIDAQGDTTSVWTVSREVKFFAMHRNFNGASSDWVTVDKENGSDVTIQFSTTN